MTQKLLVPPDKTFALDDSGTNGSRRLIGRFRTGVESLLAVPLGPWTRWMSYSEAQDWMYTLNQLDRIGAIDWSGDYPEICEPWRTMCVRTEAFALLKVVRQEMTGEERDAIAQEIHDS